VTDRSYRRAADVLWRNVGPDVILTRPKTETVAELSDSGAQVWRFLDRTSTARDVAARFDGFSHSSGEIEAGVKILLDDLVWRGYCSRGDS
jgi:hypothetical protein